MFCTGFSPADVERDILALDKLAATEEVAGAFEWVLSPGENPFGSAKVEVAEFDYRVMAQTNWGIWGIRGESSSSSKRLLPMLILPCAFSKANDTTSRPLMKTVKRDWCRARGKSSVYPNMMTNNSPVRHHHGSSLEQEDCRPAQRIVLEHACQVCCSVTAAVFFVSSSCGKILRKLVLATDKFCTSLQDAIKSVYRLPPSHVQTLARVAFTN